MKTIILFSAMSAMILLSNMAWPCSPSIFSFLWPAKDQKNVPLNAHITFLCVETVCANADFALLDSKGKEVPMTVVAAERLKNRFGQRYYIMVPAHDLRPSSSYKVVFTSSSREDTRSFETGTQVDTKPPLLDGAQIKADVKWVGDKKTVLFQRPGMCRTEELPVKEARKNGMEIEKDDYLPEHYNVSVTVDNIVDDTDRITLHLFEIMDDGTKKDLGEFNAPSLNIGTIDAKDAGTSKKYEVEARDATGNIQPSRVGFQINFDKSNSRLVR